MARKVLFILTSLALPSLLLVTVESGIAQAARTNPVLLGGVTCNAANGVWRGKVVFAPPLKNGGTANVEKIKVAAKLGSTTSPCLTFAGTPEIGAIVGKLIINDAGTANNCATIFSGAALPAPVAPSKFKLHWLAPAGTPTTWQPPGPFVVVGAAAMNNITINGATVTGSFSPYAAPTATLSDANWAAAVPAGCASAAGLRVLTLSTSSGTW
ncbi:MAG TPA: hypothetical protein VN816_03665 [Acidimicrobiales bacterium]|nr:hypothetical protein [Acidimicrobiales bacterium]